MPNNQIAKLGDGLATIEASGEIDIILYRNNLQLRFHALVCRDLHCPIIGGPLFLKTNAIIQDFTRDSISLLDGKVTVPTTPYQATLPIVPKTARNHNSLPLASIKTKTTLLPGQSINVPTELPDQLILAEAFRSDQWPPPQIS